MKWLMKKSFIQKADVPELDIKNETQKDVCIGIAKHYVRIAHGLLL